MTARAPEPWEPDDERHPLNVYGQTKYEGELAVQNTLEKYFIVRISWVFGVNGKNFIKTMLNLGKTHDHLTVVNDQFGSPTYTYDLARLLVDMVLTDKYGIYHATNEGICNWYEFACEIFRKAGMNVDVAPVPASEYPTKAKRPENSRMSKAKLTENGFVEASFLAGCARDDICHRYSSGSLYNRLCVGRKFTGNTSGSGIGNGTAPILANVTSSSF